MPLRQDSLEVNPKDLGRFFILCEYLMKLRLRIFTAFLMASFSVGTCWAGRSLTGDSSSSAGNQVVEDFKDFLSKYTQVLDHDLVTFHYAEGGPEPQNSEQLRQIMSAKSFEDPSVSGHGDRMGPGYYVAQDPMRSRAWGGKDPHLYVRTMKAGTRILNAKAVLASSEDEKKAQKEERHIRHIFDGFSRQFHCKKLDTDGNLYMAVNGLREDPNKACRKAIIDVLKDLNIGAIRYTFVSNINMKDLKGCDWAGSGYDEQGHWQEKKGGDDPSDEALNVISPEVFNDKSDAYFGTKKTIDPDEIGGFVHQMYKDETADNPDPDVPNEPAPASLKQLKAKSGTAYEKWKSRNVFGCGSKHFVEDPARTDSQPESGRQ
jgi:hypothetical protein